VRQVHADHLSVDVGPEDGLVWDGHLCRLHWALNFVAAPALEGGLIVLLSEQPFPFGFRWGWKETDNRPVVELVQAVVLEVGLVDAADMVLDGSSRT